MPDITDQTTTPDGAADASTSTGDAGTAGDAGAAGSSTTSELELARRRQAGAERARQEAERALKEANDRIAALSAGKPADQLPVDMKAILKQAKDELKAEFEAEYSKKTAEAEGRALDARFPLARAKFPEVTDTVKLAELEVLFGEPAETPKPVGNNQQRTTTGQKNIEDMTVAELRAHMRTIDPAEAGLGSR